MDVYNLKDIETEEDFKPHKLVQQDEVEVVLLPFQPGQGLPVHTTPVDVFFYVVEGEATIKIGDETIEIEEGNLILSPKDIPHTVKNESDSVTRVMVVKTPKPQ